MFALEQVGLFGLRGAIRTSSMYGAFSTHRVGSTGYGAQSGSVDLFARQRAVLDLFPVTAPILSCLVPTLLAGSPAA